MLSEELRRATEAALGTVWNADIVIDEGGVVGLAERPHVQRLRVLGAPPGSPETVVAKLPRLRDGDTFDPASNRPAVTRFFVEWTCLEFLAGVCSESPAPRLYAADPARGLLLLEDLGTGETLDQALMGHDSDRAAGLLIALMARLGRMHADTFAHREKFEVLLRQRRSPPRASLDEVRDRLMSAAKDALQQLEMSASTRFFDELGELSDRVATSTDFDVLVHGDPCPDNCHWDGARMRLLDFEHGRFDNALVDGSYVRIHFPSCWCMSRLPKALIAEAEQAYRTELARCVPAAREEDRFGRALVDASVLWAWTTFAGWHMPTALQADERWGLVSVRQRILFRFRILREMLDQGAWYPAVAEMTRQCVGVLSTKWSDAADMPLYPAFG